MLIIKGKSSTEESVEHHATGPDIHLGTSIQLARYYLHTSKNIHVRIQ
jgi:hypothetical protein